MAGIGILSGQVAGDTRDICHQLRHIMKDAAVDLLQDVVIAHIGFDQICLVDMTVAIALATDNISFDPEACVGLHHAFTPLADLLPKYRAGTCFVKRHVSRGSHYGKIFSMKSFLRISAPTALYLRPNS